MTKWRYLEDALEASPQESGAPSSFALGVVLMFGAALALTGDSHADPRLAHAQVTRSIQTTTRALTTEPSAHASLRIGDWPSQLLTRAQGTLLSLPVVDEMPMIAVVIDDLGADLARTNLAIALPANVTLSFLPYPPRAHELSRRAHLVGHEVIVHLPMQPVGGENPGERALRTGLSSDELRQRLGWALSRVSDYDGVNNHMGSRFTASYAELLPVMHELKGRSLFFLDSRTTEKTQVEMVAREVGVLTGRRNVFIDGERNPTAIARQLAHIEDFARKTGNVIAIGHPYPETLAALSKWTQTLKERGFRLVPLREVLLSRESQLPALVTAGISLEQSR